MSDKYLSLLNLISLCIILIDLYEILSALLLFQP